MKLVRVEKPIRPSPTWEQFQAIVADIRKQKFNADAQESADLVEFMGEAGVGTAECANLSGEHFDFSKGKITLYRKKTDVGYSIPIFPQVKSLLGRLKEQGRIEAGKLVFRIKDPKKALTAACRRLSFQHFSPQNRFAASAAVQSKTGNFDSQDTVRGTPTSGVPESVPVRAYQCLDWGVSRSRLFLYWTGVRILLQPEQCHHSDQCH
jgi:hypothetical protein